MKWLQTYSGFFRRVRLFHFIFNLMHRKGLQHNKRLYPAFGIKKSIYRSISTKDFEGKQAKLPWLDYPVSPDDIKAMPECSGIDNSLLSAVTQWHNRGYVIAEQFFSESAIDPVNKDIDHLLEAQAIGFNYTGRKLFNAFRHSSTINDLVNDKKLTDLLSLILGRKVFPFQTINFQYGSEQNAHSDFVHMTTFPKGYLVAAWIALEDMEEDAGPVFYYPGSHRLPYLSNSDYGATSNFFLLDGNANKKYEAKVAELLKEKKLTPKTFLAKKGDVLIWHANLAHGGSPVINPTRTRKSMVIHYFAEDVICYHEISERPAIIEFEDTGIRKR
jgi:ectoine hydroxylase